MNENTNKPRQGPAARVHEGWDGRNKARYRLDLPCGCRASDIRADAPPILGSTAHRTQYIKYYVCRDHLRVALAEMNKSEAR